MVNVVTSSDGGDRTPDLTIMSRALSPSELHRPRFFRAGAGRKAGAGQKNGAP